MKDIWTISASRDSQYYGGWLTRAEAIVNGVKEFNGHPFWVGKARSPKPLSQGIFAEWLLESAQQTLDEERLNQARLRIAKQ